MGLGLQRERYANGFEEFVIAGYAITEGRDDEVNHEHDKVSFIAQADALVYEVKSCLNEITAYRDNDGRTLRHSDYKSYNGATSRC